MLLPDKLITYSESVLAKLPILLDALQCEPLSIKDLYLVVQEQMNGVPEFLNALDCLYALQKVIYDHDSGVLKYVD